MAAHFLLHGCILLLLAVKRKAAIPGGLLIIYAGNIVGIIRNQLLQA
jgi:hypothetical protein